ncbi:MAG: N-acetylmuramoyl-L-alanine amidase [Bacteroidales bacterium]
MKRFFIFFVMLSLTALALKAQPADGRGFVRTVVIDPGHGGKAPGAVGRKSREKDITLAISLQLGQLINEHLPDVKVIYTRTTDKFVEFHERTAIANRNHADLFISIHCNAAANRMAYGTETFVMGLHVGKANLEVAKKENADILLEDNYQEKYDGYDPNSPEANIIFTLYQNAHLEHSLQIASLVQQQFRDRAMRHDRGIKQAGFLVLYQATMPSILVEAGFLSNPKEEEYLMSKQGQSHIASAIFRAFREYKQQHDALATTLNEGLTARNASVSLERQQKEIVREDAGSSGAASQVQNPNAVIFKIQFATTAEKNPVNAPQFKPLGEVEYYIHEGLYKYTVGQASTLEEAAELQLQVQQAGFKDAFVVAFHGDTRISPSEAIRLLKQQQNIP